MSTDVYIPTAEDAARWEAPEVQRFRRKLAPYLFVNGVIVLAAIVSGQDFFIITVLWSIYMAFKYAKLWAEGYDWRDVFRQPRDRELIDVFDEVVMRVRALFDKEQRQKLREQSRARTLARRTGAERALGARGTPAPLSDAGTVGAAGRHGDRIRQAAYDRDEINRIMETLAPADRNRLAEVARSALALYDKVQALALSLSAIDRSLAPGAAETIDDEIARLEGAANPLDRVASEERVRRLAYLRRQRRAIADLVRRREDASEKLETCALALQNMRLDMVRLRAGAQTHQNITTLAVNALSLADSVDSALYVADEMGRIGRRTSERSPAGP